MIGYFSLILVLFAGLIHAKRVWSGVIRVHPVSMIIWSLTGIALLVSYKTMNTNYEFYVTIGNTIFPVVNLFISMRYKVRLELSRWDYATAFFGIVSIVTWYFVRQSHELSAYANYIALFADMCAIVPTFRMVKVNPMIEKPLPWILFGIGFGINVFIITDKSFANYVLPVYMFFAANSIAVIQIIHRQKNNIKESWY
jgi:hypothetical protein